MKRAKSAGFTLVEVLVVLIIVGMISSILLQALGQIFRLQGRFGQQLAQSQEGVMYSGWFRQVIQGLQTDYPQGAGVFRGTDTELAGLSTASLSVDTYGAPANISFKMIYERNLDSTGLQYESGTEKTTIFNWPGKVTGKFVYLDAHGERHDQWPPLLGRWPQLPAVILLLPPVGAEQQQIVGVPRGSNEAKRRPLNFVTEP